MFLNLKYILAKFQVFCDCHFHQKLNCQKNILHYAIVNLAYSILEWYTGKRSI